MSGAREFIRNGQPHFINSQKVLNLRHKTRKRAYYLIPFMLLFVFTCVGFIGFLYYLDWKFNADIREFNDKINAEMKIYADKMNAKVFEFEHQIQRLNAQIEDLQKKLDKKQTTDAQDALQESESNKFKAVALENVEEFPEIEGVEEEGLEPELRTGKIVLVRQNNTGKLFDNLRPPNAGLKRNRTVASEELVKDLRHNRHRRDAEMFNTNGANLLENSGESKSAMKHDFDTFTPSVNRNDTSKEKRSSLQNHTNSNKGSQYSCASCEETIPRKSVNLQKSTNKRAMSMKKLQNVRDESTSYGELDESTDVTEIRKTAIAAHFGADSTRYNVRSHPHYEGNGHLRHPTGEYQDWTPSSWFEELNMHKHFVLLNGNIKVRSAGLYFVYAQIFYTDLSDVNGYAIYLNSQIVLQCIISTFSLNVTTKSNTCYTGGVIKCNAGDIISIKTMDVNRKVMLESTRSFVGMFKIGEFQNLK